MNAIGIIPARYGSTRFPGKPLVSIAGIPLVERVYRQAVQADLKKVIVATDDRRIRDLVHSFGGYAVMTGEHQSGTDRVAEAAAHERCSIVVNIQGDEPLIEPSVINTVARALQRNRWAAASTAAVRIDRDEEIDNPHVVKVVFAENGSALYFSRSRIPSRRAGQPEYYKHLGIYGFRKRFLMRYAALSPSPLEAAESLEQLRLLEKGYSIHVSVVRYDSRGVDLPEDVQRVESILHKKSGTG